MKSDQQVMQGLMKEDLQDTFFKHALGFAALGVIAAGAAYLYTGGSFSFSALGGFMIPASAGASFAASKQIDNINETDTLKRHKNMAARNAALWTTGVATTGTIGAFANLAFNL